MALTGYVGPLANASEFVEDWRDAEITEIALGGVISQRSSSDCRRGLPREWVVGNKYAVLKYEVDQTPHHRIAPIIGNDVLKVGDLVSMNVRDCWTRLIPRSSSAPSVLRFETQ